MPSRRRRAPVYNTDAVEVIHLENVTECDIVLHGPYLGHNAIHGLAPEDETGSPSFLSRRNL